MKSRILLFTLGVSCVACGRMVSSDSADLCIQAYNLIERGQSLVEAEETDSAIAVFLDAVDAAELCQDNEARYQVYDALSLLYEKKNLYEQQQECQEQMLVSAESIADRNLIAETHQRMAMTAMVMGDTNVALNEANLAYSSASSDTLDFLSQTLVLISQIWLQDGMTDSAACYLSEASRIYPDITKTEMYRLSHVYVLSESAGVTEMETVIDSYMQDASPYLKAELLRPLISLHESEGRYREALSDACMLLSVSDSISALESSESMTRIHHLQHRQKMALLEEQKRTELAMQRASFLQVIVVVLALLLASSAVGLFYRRRARIAHEHELDAMRLVEEATQSERQARAENIQMQRLYYEHLYAIILPILNARRSKTGHIDLEETSWELIEHNTDMVLPDFTTKMRHNHPTLSREDIRFCCLIMMRVPNAIIADVYGIAPSSVSVRKQRMKHKLDSDMYEQTLETYLNQYAF